MPIPLRIKICGITTPEDAQACSDAGADAVGLNFHPGSPRYLDPRRAAPVIRALPPLIASIGVFVQQSVAQACAIAYQLGLRGIQIHNDAPEIADAFPFAAIVPFRVRDQASLQSIKDYLELCRTRKWSPSAILVDAFVAGQHGGTGQTAPWDLLADFHPGVPLILAGGLTPDNVADAIRILKPWAIDVASGVESTPGKKDPEKIRRFINNAREAAARINPL